MVRIDQSDRIVILKLYKLLMENLNLGDGSHYEEVSQILLLIVPLVLTISSFKSFG